ncbi:ABC transporter permease [Mediterraneibacter agrestimuris]|uniref:ABC transporter permease n=1 Tax=Mediterraneibacter agrestimuris TaxID=2941333 RepID=UPI00203AA283|nr:ABC transporter permease subunit [Mediterraneibacter agrestimuris]
MRKKRKSVKWKRYLPLYFMALPALVYLFINNYLPMTGLVVAFKNFNYKDGIFGSPWCGFANFEYLFSTSTSFIITRNTIVYNAVFIILNTVAGVAAAVLLNEIRSKKAVTVFQTTMIIPYLLSMIIIGYLVFAFLSSENGFINKHVLNFLGVELISWYASPKVWPWLLIFINTLKNFGFLALIYYSTLISVSNEYYEAAKLDGANKWQQIWYITIPYLKPTIITMVLLSVGRVFYSDFGLFYQVPQNSGALYSVTNTIDTYVYRSLIQLGDVGMASAAGVYQSIVGFLLVLAANAAVRKISPDNAMF